MKTIATGRIGEEGEATLFVDILADPPGAAIRRQDGGLVRIEAGELDDLIQTLIRAACTIGTPSLDDEYRVLHIFPAWCPGCGDLMYFVRQTNDYLCKKCQDGDDER